MARAPRIPRTVVQPPTVPHVRVVRELVPGAWLGEHEQLGCEVVVEVSRDGASRARLAEAHQAASKGASPLFPRVLGGGELPGGGAVYLVSELPAGEALAALSARGERLASDAVIELAKQLAWGLERLHASGSVHGGLDGACVVLSRAGGRVRARLLSRGLARAETVAADDLAALAELAWSAADDSTRAALSAWLGDARRGAFSSALELADAMVDAVEASGATSSRAVDPASELTLIGRLLAAGDHEAVEARVAAHSQALYDAGLAGPLAALLSRSATPRLDALRLRARVEEGDPVALAAEPPPESTSPEARLAWAMVLLARGRHADAEAALPSPGELARADAQFEAQVVRARAAANQGDVLRSAALLEAASAPSEGALALRDAMLATSLAHVDARRANRLASAARRRVDSAGPSAARRVAPALVHALVRLGRPRDALVELDAAPPPPSEAAARHASFLRAVCLYETGELAAAERAVERLRGELGPDAALTPYVDYVSACTWLALGRTHDVASRLPLLAAATARLPEVREAVWGLSVQLARVSRRPPPAERPTGSTTLGRHAWLHSLISAARAGVVTAEERVALEAPQEVGPELALLSGLARAVHALAGGAHEEALRLALDVVADARVHGHVICELDARVVSCEALAAASLRDALEEAAEALRAQAVRVGAARAAAVGDLFLRVVRPGPACFAELERARVGDLGEASALAAALLGAPPTCDRVDAAVVAGVRAWLPTAVAASADASRSDGAAWGLALASKESWLPDGTRVAFGDAPLLWRLLVALSRGGDTSKEALTKHVWGAKDYHPHRDDNRLQAAIRKLRVRLSDADRSLVVTRDDGYALGGTVRCVEEA